VIDASQLQGDMNERFAKIAALLNATVPPKRRHQDDDGDDVDGQEGDEGDEGM
jgi:hypothetical protein